MTLLRLTAQLVDDRDEEAEGDECTRRQDEEQNVVSLRQQRQAEDGAVAEQFTTDAQQRQAQREAQADADAVEERSHGRLLGCEGLGTSEDDTVHDDQRDEEAQRGVDLRQEGLDDHLENRHEGGNHDDEHGDAHLVGRDRLQAGDDKVGADEHRHRGQAHRHTVQGTGGRGQRGTHTEHQDERGVLLHNAVLNDTYIIHIIYSVLWRRSRRQRRAWPCKRYKHCSLRAGRRGW